jgi:hypothetical protein
MEPIKNDSRLERSYIFSLEGIEERIKLEFLYLGINESNLAIRLLNSRSETTIFSRRESFSREGNNWQRYNVYGRVLDRGIISKLREINPIVFERDDYEVLKRVFEHFYTLEESVKS